MQLKKLAEAKVQRTMSNLAYDIFRGFCIAVASLVVIFTILAKILRRVLLRKQTAVQDLAILGLERNPSEKIQGTAVICGGSIAGLAAARVAHDHFSEVVIIESEEWLNGEDGWIENVKLQKNTRSRIIQWFSLQGVQVMGFYCLSKLFPNLAKECALSDIRILPGDFKTSTWGHWTKTPHSYYKDGLPSTLFVGRPGLETLIRRMVIGRKSYPNIKQISGTVLSLEPSKHDGTRLERVTYRSGESVQSINAALVIDCTGPACSGLKWLRRAGYGASESYSGDSLPLDQLKISYDPEMRYATFQVVLTPELMKKLPIPGGYTAQVGPIYNCITDADQDYRSIYTQRIERDTIQICCGVYGSADMPQTMEAVVEYCKTLVVQVPIPAWFFDFLVALSTSDNITCSTVRVPPPSYVRYQKAVNLPSNWIAIGDSVMRVNPIFGQGCTKALLGAASMNTILHESRAPTIPNDFSSRFFKVQAAKIEPIWLGTKLGDYAYTTTTPAAGETLEKGSFLRWYVRKLHALAFTNKKAGSALWHVKMFLAPSIDYFQIELVFGIFWGAFLDYVRN